jgi:hypothetical protein
LTFIISEKTIGVNKIDYITENYADKNNLITYPIISTIILLTVVPFLSNGAYWLSLKFEQWKKDQKQLVEMKELITLEKSIELREQIHEQEKKFEKLLESKNLEIKQLNAIIESSKTESRIETNQEGKTSSIDKTQQDLHELYQRIVTNVSEKAEYDKLIQFIQGGYQVTGSQGISPKLISLLEAHSIIESKGNGVYRFTELGKKLQLLMLK